MFDVFHYKRFYSDFPYKWSNFITPFILVQISNFKNETKPHDEYNKFPIVLFLPDLIIFHYNDVEKRKMKNIFCGQGGQFFHVCAVVSKAFAILKFSI